MAQQHQGVQLETLSSPLDDISDRYSICLNGSLAHLSNVFGEVITLEKVATIYMQKQIAALFLNVVKAYIPRHF